MARPLGCLRTPSPWVLSHTRSKTAEVAGGKSITGFQGKMGTLFEAKTKDCDFGSSKIKSFGRAPQAPLPGGLIATGYR
jgi:hypothetical protein